ncbi:MAG: glycosyltransferase family 9 protein, partial [Opitutaceae bacterium]
LLAKQPFLPLLQLWKVGDQLIPLPPHGVGYFGFFLGLRGKFPDVWLLFTNSLRGDLEAWLSGCRQRFGIVRTGKRRPLLSHAYRVPATFDEHREHQLKLWEDFLLHFGLNAPLAFTPLPSRQAAGSEIGLICGSENNPGKRWPTGHWRALIESLPHERFILFGTKNDAPLTTAVATGFPLERVADLAGKTDLSSYVARLRACRLLVTNDTGGMHLANALGVPLIALFGPTNPVRTGPVFQAPARILQPPGCAPTGGGVLADLAPAVVAMAVQDLLAQTGVRA